MLKPVSARQANQAYVVTNRLIDAINILDNDIEALVGVLPIKPSEAVAQFTRLIRKDVGTQSMKAVGYGGIDTALRTVFGQSTPTMTVRQHTEDFAMEITPENNIGLTDHEGTLIDLTVPQSNFTVIESLSTQADSKKLIDPVMHQDQDMLTINFYTAGKGIKYMLPDTNGVLVPTSFKSPCITVHRGVAHPFQEAGAVWHTGQSNEGREAANILWDIRYRPATMLMLG